jgi:DNA polymerase III epsilon subunit-like protein
MSIVYYILDTETCGLNLDYHEINQISVMRVSDEKQYSTNIRVKNPNKFDFRSLEVQGISPADLKTGIPVEEAINNVERFFNEDGQSPAHRCIVAHNAPFDRKFVHRAWERANKEFPADLWICTQSFSKRYVKKHACEQKIAKAQMDGGVDDIKADKLGRLKPKFGLNNMLVGLGISPIGGAHRAEIDVQNTLILFNWLIESKTEHVSLIQRIPHKESNNLDLDMEDF